MTEETRDHLRYTSLAAAAIALAYLGWVGMDRYMADLRLEERLAARHARSPQPYTGYTQAGGPGVRILQFYASAGEVTRGEHAVVCYGVQNAHAVRLEPPVEELKPALNRCFAVTPTATTTYRLTAEGQEGTEASAAFTVQVNPPPPSILFVALSGKQIRRGEPFTMCYGVKNAHAARLDPVGMKLAPVEKACIRMYPARSTNFTFVADGDGGRTDREKFTLEVK